MLEQAANATALACVGLGFIVIAALAAIILFLLALLWRSQMDMLSRIQNIGKQLTDMRAHQLSTEQNVTTLTLRQNALVEALEGALGISVPADPPAAAEAGAGTGTRLPSSLSLPSSSSKSASGTRR